MRDVKDDWRIGGGCGMLKITRGLEEDAGCKR